ncbi:hypothetical protein [Peribacillus butanolivorans]|uniref:hypothetical protein n=1 Tax=Peribacillus butanolivorans TaxID=421767 RepID=UPI0036D94CF2
MATKVTTQIKRLDEEEIKSHFVIRKFFTTVPYSELEESEAIVQGLSESLDFISKYPLDDYEYASVAIPKNNDEINV